MLDRELLIVGGEEVSVYVDLTKPKHNSTASFWKNLPMGGENPVFGETDV